MGVVWLCERLRPLVLAGDVAGGIVGVYGACDSADHVDDVGGDAHAGGLPWRQLKRAAARADPCSCSSSGVDVKKDGRPAGSCASAVDRRCDAVRTHAPIFAPTVGVRFVTVKGGWRAAKSPGAGGVGHFARRVIGTRQLQQRDTIYYCE